MDRDEGSSSVRGFVVKLEPVESDSCDPLEPGVYLYVHPDGSSDGAGRSEELIGILCLDYVSRLETVTLLGAANVGVAEFDAARVYPRKFDGLADAAATIHQGLDAMASKGEE